jgi:hypothetical protein
VKKTARKKAAVRMFEQAVRITTRTSEFSMSGTTSGRLGTNLRRYVGRLKHLAQEGPNDLFWPTLQKAILKLVKYVRDAAP